MFKYLVLLSIFSLGSALGGDPKTWSPNSIERCNACKISITALNDMYVSRVCPNKPCGSVASEFIEATLKEPQNVCVKLGQCTHWMDSFLSAKGL